MELPTGSGQSVNLDEAATNLSRRLMKIFLRDEYDKRAFFGNSEIFQYEYFHGDSGAGLDASHQSGWTALVAKLIQQSGGQEL